MKLLEHVLNKRKIWKVIGIVLFAAYCFFIVWETVLSRKVSSARTFELRLFWGFTELITGEGNGEYVSKQYLLNILFFIPFGLLFPWKKKWWIPVAAGFLFSAFIEITQYVTARGLCELDDVIANTIGALISVAMVFLLKQIILVNKSHKDC